MTLFRLCRPNTTDFAFSALEAAVSSLPHFFRGSVPGGAWSRHDEGDQQRRSCLTTVYTMDFCPDSEILRGRECHFSFKGREK